METANVLDFELKKLNIDKTNKIIEKKTYIQRINEINKKIMN